MKMHKLLLLLCLLFVSREVACRGGGRAGGGRFGGRGRAGATLGGRSGPSRPRGQPGWFSPTRGKIFSGTKFDERQWEDSFSYVNKRIQSNRISTNFGTKKLHSQPKSRKLGFGVGPTFLHDHSFVSTLIIYSIYHRYVYLQKKLAEAGHASSFDGNHYYQLYTK